MGREWPSRQGESFMSRTTRGLFTLAAIALVAGTAVPLFRGGTAQSQRPAERAPTALTGMAKARLLTLIDHSHTAPINRREGLHSAKTGQLGSYNWSGYLAFPKSGDDMTQVAGTWKEPAISCYGREFEEVVFWVGLDGWSNDTVEQDGTLAVCYLGKIYHYTWWEMYPTNQIQIVGTSLKPGDTVKASVVFKESSKTYTLSLTDTTHRTDSFTKVEHCASNETCANSSAEWIGETPGFFPYRGYTPLPAFGKWNLAGASATQVTAPGCKGAKCVTAYAALNGATKASSITSFDNDSITMESDDNYALATPGRTSAGGTAFSDTWDDSY